MTSTVSAAVPGGPRATPAGPAGWFPGRLIGGAALVAAPLVWSAGLLLRHLAARPDLFTPAQRAGFAAQPFAAPAQLAAYAADPALVTAGYACFAAGAILLCPALLALAGLTRARGSRIAALGGVLATVGLFSRLYWAGVDHTAFHLVDRLGLEQATRLVMDGYVEISYGPWRVPITAAFGLYLGWLLLGVAAARAGVFGTGRLLLFLWSGTLWTGVLKESGPFDGVASSAALGLVLVPLGVAVLRGAIPAAPAAPGAARPAVRRWRRVLSW
ncbi:hypothetical protein [Bailinhaonella thermotolerans]|uniref:hypothetical protein n=1 Tax=Bailinhaonella thermotolerans TaxID=1070861 RepID=UPI00192A5B8D|nr:hypothetical protein [Bailinhaonella thermotolerans]